MSSELKFLYQVLLKHGGKVMKVEVTGNLYMVTTRRPVYNQHGDDGPIYESEFMEVHVLRPICRKS